MVAGLVVRIASGDGALQSVSLLEPAADKDGDYILFAEMKVDRNGEVGYPTADHEKMRSVFEIKLPDRKITTHEVQSQHGPRLRVVVSIVIEEFCVERILDELKKLLPGETVLFRQVVGYVVDPIYERLGFTIKPHEYFPQGRPRCPVTDITMTLRDWRAVEVGDKRSDEDEQTNKKVKTNEQAKADDQDQAESE